MGLRILYFAAGAGADVAADVDYEYLVSHIDFTLMHVVQHFLRAFRPDFIVSRVAEKAHGDNDIAFKSKALLGFQELLLEAGAAAQGYDFVFSDHMFY